MKHRYYISKNNVTELVLYPFEKDSVKFYKSHHLGYVIVKLTEEEAEELWAVVSILTRKVKESDHEYYGD